MTYYEKLLAAKEFYPFDTWRKWYLPDEDGGEGMQQYTHENCDKAQKILDDLIDYLAALGESASEEQKLGFFEKAVLQLNALDEEVDGLIETMERENLCELIDEIAKATGINPEKYGDGDGVASEWREW